MSSIQKSRSLIWFFNIVVAVVATVTIMPSGALPLLTHAADRVRASRCTLPALEAFPHFRAPVYYSVGYTPYAVIAVDVNGDGYRDLITANNTSNTVSVLINKGDGTFKDAVSYPVGTRPANVIAADLKGDGHPDLITANIGSNDVSVLVNNGDGTFKDAVSYPVGTGPRGLTFGDFDEDGYLGIATANMGSNTITILHNKGDGSGILSSTSTINFSEYLGPVDIVADDFERDGRTDLATTNNGSQSPLVAVLHNNGDGTFATPTLYPNSGGAYITSADLNEDGYPDLITSNLYQSTIPGQHAFFKKNASAAAGNDQTTIKVLINKGDGTFKDAVSYPSGNNPRRMDLADMNMDGHLDLVSTDYGNENILIRPGKGDGTLEPSI